MRPVGPRKRTGVPLYYVLWLDPGVCPPDILIQQDGETEDFYMYGGTKIQSVYPLSGISERDSLEQLQCCSISFSVCLFG